MVKITDLCTSCVQIITNPICPYCFSKQVVMWLRDKKLSPQKIARIKNLLRHLVKEAEENPSDINCIICGSKRVNLCMHCFTLMAKKIVEQNTEEHISHEFGEEFDTIIWRI